VTPGVGASSGSWLEAIRSPGFDALQRAFLDVLEGRVEAKSAHVLSPA
jgi:hypothetical protein